MEETSKYTTYLPSRHSSTAAYLFPWLFFTGMKDQACILLTVRTRYFLQWKVWHKLTQGKKFKAEPDTLPGTHTVMLSQTDGARDVMLVQMLTSLIPCLSFKHSQPSYGCACSGIQSQSFHIYKADEERSHNALAYLFQAVLSSSSRGLFWKKKIKKFFDAACCKVTT